MSMKRKRSIFGTLRNQQCSIRSNKSNKAAEHIVVYLPANYPSCPPGLEKLIPVDHLFVHQGICQTEPPYAVISKTKYEVLDGEGHRLFLGRDSMDNILKLCCRGGCGQPFRMSIKDKHSGYEILAVNGHADCYGAMSASISQNGMNLGFLTEDLQCCFSNYIVIDAQGNEIFRIYDVGSSSKETRTQANIRNDNANEVQAETNANVSQDRTDTDSEDKGECVATTEPDFANPKDGDTIISSTANEDEGMDAIDETTDGNGSPSPSSQNRDKNKRDVNEEIVEMRDCPTTEPEQKECQRMSRERVGSIGSVADTVLRRPCLCSLCCRVFGKCSPRGIAHCLDSCISLISGGVEFEVFSCELGVVVGRMSKQWEELYDTTFNLVDCFGVSFPKDLSVRHKALILGALFLLDFNHFQL